MISGWGLGRSSLAWMRAFSACKLEASGGSTSQEALLSPRVSPPLPEGKKAVYSVDSRPGFHSGVLVWSIMSMECVGDC